ncbi:fructosamine kinase family protein [Halobiforma nitratireducens]|uniref:Fructosamine/Ketosamine-3-kinase n=1 Tax=Halobiforma nitratireducens JCM 10879 TaxID=1227454 RepID=M0LNN8_9EURY|nr:fructosamine kinase family protein [Halobiforma nitratireducens]EMA35167.1 Fructosamine/Ketosamine-3-kinase [Halobiforma nitratireducens JCM 10879]
MADPNDDEAAIVDAVASALASEREGDSSPVEARKLEGGQIGSAHRVDLADGSRLVAKVGETPLSVEAYMLRTLACESTLPVPDVYHVDDDLLVLEFVAGSTDHDAAVARDAADHLAALHDRSADAFGLERDTLTGPVRQPNPWTDSWIDFYREHRLEHVQRLALADGALPSRLAERLDAVAADLEGLIEEPDAPALIHGDAWTTNVLSADGSVTAFLDPATYYAHPEIELAYVDWTGTFGDPFFDRYRESRPLDSEFFDRRRYVYRLYPLLVHVLLFGGEYVQRLEVTLDRLGY